MRVLKSIMLAGAMLLATPVFFSSCEEDATNLKYKMEVTVVNDFTKVVEAINNGALKNEQAINQLKQAIDQMNADQKTKMQAIIAAINAVNNTLDTKLAVIEAAIKAQTLSMEAKMDLIHDIIAAQTSALELKLAAIETAMKEESIALADKLALVEKAIKDQTTNFDTKMELLTTAITSMPDYSAKLAAIETAISNVPDYATQLAAIKAVLSNVNSTLTDKLALLEGINDAITDNAAKLDAIKAVIDALPDYSTEFANIKTEIANLLQAVKDGTTSTETALAAIAAKIEEMKAAGGVSGGGTTGGGTGTEKIVPKDFVDLGLPSGLLWAKYNIGAATESETGGYFSWGETAPKTDFGYGKYKFWNGSTFTKYNWSDNLMELQPEDDAAFVNLGPWCHIPTKAEWEELIEKCTWEATKVTMPGTTESVVAYWKVTGPNGNHIILPSIGYYWDDGLHFSWSFLTSSSCHPKIFVKEFSYFLMSCHQHCLGVNLLVQR